MAWLDRLRNVLRPGRLQGDVERELAFHVRERVDELRAGGMSEDEAQRTARRQFGNSTVQVERTRDMDINQRLEALLRNLRLAARALWKTPAFTATVVVTLALGIGANSAVFSAIYAVLLRPLPFPQSDQLMTLGQQHPKIRWPQVAPVRLEDWNRLSASFQAISGYYIQDDSEISGDLPERVRHALVAPRFLQVMGVAPALGRDFTQLEEHAGGPQAVLISDRFWRRRFGADPNVTGKILRMGGWALPVIGVMPPSFVFPDRAVDLWTVSPPDLSFAKARDLTWFTGVGRVKAGVSLEQAQANLTTVQADLGREYPKTDKDITVLVKPLKEVTVGAAKSSLWLLFGSVTLLLVIACTNVAALLLARAVSRQHEIAVRFSLGASRATVIAQLLAEAWVLALAGAALGLGVAAGASGVFRSLAKDLPRIDEIGLDWRLVLYTLACAVAATLLCGVFPAIRGTRRNLAGSMAQSGRSRVAGRNPVQFALVGVQVALAVTLLTGAGLLVRSFQALGRVSPGFDPERVLSFRVSSSWGETGDPKAAKQRLHTILEGLRAMTGVEEASTTFGAPGVPTDVQAELKSAEGRAETEPKLVTQIRTVTPAYFATMRIPILSGEVCRDEPNTITMMVNRSFANAYYAGSTPVGRHLLQTANPYLPSGEVRGIVGDAREMGMDHEPAPTAYYCFGSMQPGLYFLVRTRSDPKTLAGTIRRQFHEIEPGRSVYGVAPLVEQISDAYAENRLRTILLVFFATTAVSLACVGLYGTISYLVNVRRREVGLRLALGAMRTQIVRQFVSQGMIVSALGCAVGIGLAAALARLFAGMLYGVSASDATTLGGVVVTVLAVSVLASLLPAIRAARLEPMQVLRDE